MAYTINHQSIQVYNHFYVATVTHWLSHSDHSVQSDHIGMVELAHDGRLLQELDLLYLTCCWSKRFHSNVLAPPGRLPHTSVDLTKVSSPNMFSNPKKDILVKIEVVLW